MNQDARNEQARRMAEEKFDAFLSQYSDEEQERILRYALDHVLPKYKGRSPAIAAALVKLMDGQKWVAVVRENSARYEWMRNTTAWQHGLDIDLTQATPSEWNGIIDAARNKEQGK